MSHETGIFKDCPRRRGAPSLETWAADPYQMIAADEGESSRITPKEKVNSIQAPDRQARPRRRVSNR